MTEITKKLSKSEAIRELWKMGELSYKLHSGQKLLNDTLSSTSEDIVTILCSRRFGKTYWLLILACSVCLKKKGATVKFVSPKQKQAKTNVKKLMRTILSDCPKELRPEFKVADGVYIWPNGSEIQIAGTDNQNYKNLRGDDSDLNIVDEAGFCDDLFEVVFEVLYPTTTLTKAKTILSSTPSPNMQHDYITKFVRPGLAADRVKIFTIEDNPMISEERKKEIADRFPLKAKDPAYLREYMCKIFNSDDDSVVPGFDEFKDSVIGEQERPKFFDWYVSGDIGLRDLTIFIFGYYDFLKARYVIEDELVIHEKAELVTRVIAQKLIKKERELYPDITGEATEPYRRVMDVDLRLINELQLLHGITFIPTEKTDKEIYINQLRMAISSGQMLISPKCKHVLYHIDSAIWNKSRTEFQRLPDSSDGGIRGGHADGLDALIYFVRNVIKSKNPYPRWWGKESTEDLYIRKEKYKKPKELKFMDKIMNIKRGKKF